jgi:chemotaxis protein methyltransferase CheR
MKITKKINISKSEPLSPEQRDGFIQLIAKHTGLEIRERDQGALSGKIFSRMKALKLTSPLFYSQLLESSTPDSYKEWLELAILLTNTESYFFRDREQFSLLRNHIFPQLINRKQNSKSIRICSAGCSTGEEPYSIAILLKELIPNLRQWNLTILGVDINRVALKKAELGVYSPWSFRSIAPDIKQRYFQLINGQYHIDQTIKEMIKFQTLNLVDDYFPQQYSELRNIDLIICRNVFIYFKAAAIAKVLKKFYHTLQPLGYLLTGHAELSNQNLSFFQTKVFSESLIYQRPGRAIINPLQVPACNESNDSSIEDTPINSDDDALKDDFETNNITMQQVALNLLRQLSPDTRIQKLGNLTAAELILQIETELNLINQELT